MLTVLGLGAGALAGGAVWWALRAVLSHPTFARENHRGVPVATAGGVVVPLASLGVVGAVSLVERSGALDAGQSRDRGAVLALVCGLALLGLVDDLAGTGDDGRGFRGHLRALAAGRLTTGALKLVGGGALALAVCTQVSSGGVGRLLGDALLVALAANLGNLFDRAPGRTLKVGGLAFVGLMAATGSPSALAEVAVVVGAAVALAPMDLGERLMLGDTGANALGGVLGLGVVLTTAPGTRTAVLVAVAALNLAGEVVSFSRVIDGVTPLRALDRAGRRR